MIQSIYIALDKYAKRMPFTWIYGLARSILAISTLITLLFTEPKVLFDREVFESHLLNTEFGSINIFFVLGYENIEYSYIICIVILLIIISGIYPQITGILHWLISFSFFTAATIIEGGDQIISIITLLLIPVTLVDPRSNHWFSVNNHNISTYRTFTANVMFEIIKLQMAVVYLHSGIDKLYKLDEWRNGTALYYFFNDPSFGYSNWISFFLSKPLTNPYFVSSLTWGTIIFELILFGAIFMTPSRRKKLFIPAVLFHLGIALIIGLISFSVAMVGGLVLYLIPKQQGFPALKYWQQFILHGSILNKLKS